MKRWIVWTTLFLFLAGGLAASDSGNKKKRPELKKVEGKVSVTKENDAVTALKIGDTEVNLEKSDKEEIDRLAEKDGETVKVMGVIEDNKLILRRPPPKKGKGGGEGDEPPPPPDQKALKAEAGAPGDDEGDDGFAPPPPADDDGDGPPPPPEGDDGFGPPPPNDD